MMAEYRWWEDFDERYVELKPKWDLIDDVYEADVGKLRTDKYLIRRETGEHEKSFNERKKLANFVPLFAAVVDAYVGRIIQAEKKIVRVWNHKGEDGLGDPKDPSTPAGRIWQNADGKGTNYVPLLAQVATMLTTKKVAWAITEGPLEVDGQRVSDSYARLIQPQAVPITVEDGAGNLVMAVVCHWHNTKTSVFEQGEKRKRFTVYGLDGFAVFELQEKKKERNSGSQKKEQIVRVDGGTGFELIPYGGTDPERFYYYDSPERNLADRILPIFRVELPTMRHPGHTLAEQNIVFFNTYSELQNKHRTCSIIRATMPYKDEDDRQRILADLNEGPTVWFYSAESSSAPGFAEPSAASLSETREWLEDMRGDFLFSALRGYEDSARGAQRTATEAAQDAAQGEHSYLNMLASALDEFEMQAWKRLEQIEWPDQPERWGQFFVERKKDFRPLDEEGEAERLRSTFFGMNVVPIGSTGRSNAAKRVAELYDVEYDEAEVDLDVQRRDFQAAQENALLSELGVNGA